jgi:hypothetical protein
MTVRGLGRQQQPGIQPAYIEDEKGTGLFNPGYYRHSQTFPIAFRQEIEDNLFVNVVFFC